MSKLSRGLFTGAFLAAIGLAVAAFMSTPSSAPAQPPATDQAAEPAPPEGQSYTGWKKCASCHFTQAAKWKKTKHAAESSGGKLMETLPEKYRTDATCLPCHTTGYGQATGFKDAESTPHLAATTCEACHGPGSEHEKVCKAYANKKKLAPDEEKKARDSIYKIVPGNVCLRCHTAQGHKDEPKPKE